jgi:hypothetical protein
MNKNVIFEDVMKNIICSIQELLGPIYFLAVIIVLKLALGNPRYPAVTSPPGSSSPTNTNLLFG